MKLFSENIFTPFFIDTLPRKLYNISVNKIRKLVKKMKIVEWLMTVFLLLPLVLLFASMCLELIVDIVRDIIENFKGE